jgi:hypothetical protein
MFHPLLQDLSEFKLEEIELKISDLSRKYFMSARSGNSGLCYQIGLVLESYKAELQKRNLANNKIASRNSNQDLDSLINVDR